MFLRRDAAGRLSGGGLPSVFGQAPGMDFQQPDLRAINADKMATTPREPGQAAPGRPMRGALTDGVFPGLALSPFNG